MPTPPARRFFSDGESIWYVETLWSAAALLPEFALEMERIPGLDEVAWFNEAWGKRPTCRAVIDHCRRINEADLSHPIILAPQEGPLKGCVLDGMHRIGKAMLAGHTSVRAVQLLAMPEPDERVASAHPGGAQTP